MSYDLRNIRTVFQTTSCHEGIVTNLRFLPCRLEAELSSDEIVHEEDSDIDSTDRKNTGKRRNSAQLFFDLVAPVKQQVDDSETKSTNRKHSSTRRTSAQDFFDAVAPVQQRKCSEETFNTSPDSQTVKSIVPRRASNDSILMSVPEENTTTNSSYSNNQVSREEEVVQAAFNLKNKRHTALQLSGREFLGSDNVFPSPNELCSTPQDRPIHTEYPNNYNAVDMNQVEERLQDMEIRMNEKLMSMHRKLDGKLEEKSESLHDVIIHGFRSIHCNLWTMHENDVWDIKNKVTTIHENYSQINDVFIENVRLKEQLLQLQQQQQQDPSMDADEV